MTWYVRVANNAEANDCFDQVEHATEKEAKVAVFDIISNAGPGHVQVDSTNVEETILRLHISPYNPGPETWIPFYVFMFEVK